jgi:hypothetical protein
VIGVYDVQKFSGKREMGSAAYREKLGQSLDDAEQECKERVQEGVLYVGMK